MTPGVAQRAPRPYLALNPAEIARLQVAEGDEVEVTFNQVTYHLSVKSVPALPGGVVGLPVGLPGFVAAILPGTYARILAQTKVGSEALS